MNDPARNGRKDGHDYVSTLRRIRQLEERFPPELFVPFLIRGFDGRATCNGDLIEEAEYRQRYRGGIVVEIINEPFEAMRNVRVDAEETTVAAGDLP